jgi:hypothetical protein
LKFIHGLPLGSLKNLTFNMVLSFLQLPLFYALPHGQGIDREGGNPPSAASLRLAAIFQKHNCRHLFLLVLLQQSLMNWIYALGQIDLDKGVMLMQGKV